MTAQAKPKGLTIPKMEEDIASKIADLMERDGIAWTQEWAGMKPFFNAFSQHTYTGNNIFSLMIASMLQEIDDPRFLTFKQARMLGGCVKKGSKGIPIVFYGTARDKQSAEEKRYRFGRISYVFPLSAIDGLEDADLPPAGGDMHQNPDEVIDHAQAFFAATGSEVITGGDRASYAKKRDVIRMPTFASFTSAEAYYGTLAHEHIHWTGNATRLDRTLSMEQQKYAFEELVAEIGSVLLCVQLGIVAEPSPANAAYVKGWARHIRAQPHAFWDAAKLASNAVAHLVSLQPDDMEEAA